MKEFVILTFIYHTAKASREARILSGTLANPGEFKYAVALQRNGRTICSGAIIDDEYILTAAHCVINSDNEFIKGKIVVVAGTNDLQARDTSRRERTVIRMYVPESYINYPTNTDYAEDDIAILRVKYFI